jgi:putative PEP-CTERM system TPR-repeat lipoprotein
LKRTSRRPKHRIAIKRTVVAAAALLVVLVVSVLFTATWPAKDPERPLASAREYLQKNDLKSAAIQVKNALQIKPDLGEARYLLGQILLQQGNAGAAEIELRKALAVDYPEKRVVPDLALSLVMLGQHQKLVDEFSHARFGDATADASLQTTLAAAYGALGKPDLVESALTAALQADPHHAPALLLRARQKAAARDVDSALATVDQVLTRDPRNVDAWKLQGDLLLHAKGGADDALAAYRKGVEARPDFLPARFALTAALMQQGKLDDAAAQLAELKRIAAADSRTVYLDARLAVARKDYKLARELSQQLLLTANSPRNLELAGLVELRLNSLEKAERYLAAAVGAAPELGLARQLLVRTYLRSGQPAKALATLNDAMGPDGLDPGLFMLAGQAHLQSGDAKTAEEYFAKALRLDPNNARKETALALTHLVGAGEGTAALDELQSIAESDTGSTADLVLISAELRRRNFPAALAAIAKLEAKQPDKPLAADLRGRVQLAQKDSAAARMSFEQALKLDPTYFSAVAALAAIDMAEKKPDEARKRFEGLLATDPNNGHALLALAQLAAARGASTAEVVALVTKAIQANPADAAPRLMLIEVYLGVRDSKQAIAAAQNGLSALPNSPELLDALGRAQLLAGETNQAISTLGKLAALKPLLPMPQMRLAAAHMTNKDPQAAEQSLRKALELKPGDAQIQRGLLFVLLEQRKGEEAMAIARAAQKQRPKESLGFDLEGDLRGSLKDWDRAVAAYRTGLRVEPSTALAMKLHTAITMAGKAAEGERFAATWMSAHPKDAAFLMYLGDSSTARKDYAAAEKHYLAALQVQPDSASALNNLAWVTQQLGKPGGIAYAEKANALVPNQPAFMDTLAVLLSEKGDHAGAVALERKAVELQPENASFRLNLAKIYLAAGEKLQAKAELDTVAKLGDKHPLYPEASGLLKTL